MELVLSEAWHSLAKEGFSIPVIKKTNDQAHSFGLHTSSFLETIIITQRRRNRPMLMAICLLL